MADDVAAVDLIKADLDLLLEPSVVGQQAIDGFLYQLAGFPSGASRKLIQRGFLIRREMDFHPFTLEAVASDVKRGSLRFLTSG